MGIGMGASPLSLDFHKIRVNPNVLIRRPHDDPARHRMTFIRKIKELYDEIVSAIRAYLR
jgi:hypothetical protein